MKNLLVFDVESDGLFGKGFAYGYVILRDCKIVSYDIKKSECKKIENKWVRENVLPVLNDIKTVKTNKELRDKFWDILCKNEDLEIYSDVNFPVETNFLEDIARDDLKNRGFFMPYPLKDISTIVNIDVSRSEVFNKDLFSRYPNLLFSKNTYELQEHNPLHDSLASAYLLMKKTKVKKKKIILKNMIDDYINHVMNHKGSER